MFGSSSQKAPHPRQFTTENSIVMLLDHQRDAFKWIKSRPPETVISACRVLARMAKSYDMPLFITTTMEDEVGTTIPDIQEVAPEAYRERLKRGGLLTVFDDPKVVEATERTKRKKIIVAGITTDICIFWSVTDALARGFEVLVVADGCGTMTTLGDDVSFQRLRDKGATITVVNQVVTELANNLDAPQGHAAKQIMTEEVLSKLVR